MNGKTLFLTIVLLITAGRSFAQQDTILKSSHTISAGIGAFNVLDYPDIATHLELEYYAPWRAWVFHPCAGLSFANGNILYLYAGVTLPIRFADRFLLRLGFAPGVYWSFDPRYDLGCALEFRSSLKLAYVLKNNSCIGIQFAHISNAGLGNKNPGTETLVISYEAPLRFRGAKE